MFGSPDQEPWSYGTEHESLNRRAIELRYQLLPHIYNVMREAAESGLPAMRSLMLEYPDDERTYGIGDQFLFGSDLLVAPVLREGATERGVYIPAGDWYDYWSGAHYTGPKVLIVPVTLSSIPIFVRGGAFVFKQPVVQHTGETPGSLEVTLFPSPSSERWLYEDAGNGFDYQRGVSARRRFAAHREMSGLVIEIGSPDGSYRPQPRSMVLTVRSQADAAGVSVGGVSLPRVADLEKVDRGWTAKDGSLLIKLPDRFERVEIRIDNATPGVSRGT